MRKRVAVSLLIGIVLSITILAQPAHAQSEVEHGIKPCLLCQFLSNPYIQPESIVVIENLEENFACEIIITTVVSGQFQITSSTRAPPV